ncbi:MAG TPA: carboxypeptidase regulatory-like domain-containing protein [Myxococcales bacterium]|jgi:hypothetical protein
MRNRVWVGGIALGAVALVSWYLLRPATTDEAAASAGGTESSSPTAAPAKLNNALLNAELPAAKGALTIHGRVLGPSGPVSGAIVVASADGGEEVLSDLEAKCDERCEQKLLQAGCPEAAGQLVELAVQRRGEAPPLARATSGDDGSFALEGLEDGSFALWAEKPGVLIGLERGVRAGAEGVEVKVDPGMVVRGRTVTDADKPVAGASVTAIFAESTRFFDAVSGADGSFAIGPVPRAKLTVVASARGLLPAAAAVSGSFPDVRRLDLPAPRRLGGSVTREEEPARGVTVTLEGPHRRLKAASGEGGAFLFPGLRPGRYTLVASEGTYQARETLNLEAGKDVLDVALRLGPGGELVGTVRGVSGRPVADARVIVGSRQARAEQRTGSDGTYHVAALPAGKYRARVDAEAFLESEVREFEVAEGGTATADFSLEDASPLEGLVVDEEGNPVEGAQVQAQHAGSDRRGDDPAKRMRGVIGSASSHRDGSFSVDKVSPGPFEVWVVHEAYLDLRLDLTAPTKTARLVLSRGIELTGTVVDEEDQPVAGARVMAIPDQGADDPRPRAPGSFKRCEATTARGEFAVRGLDEGPYEVTASAGGTRGDGRQASQRVVVHGPKTGPIKLQFPKGLSISGKVVGQDGKPATEVRIFARMKELEGAEGSPDSEGRFSSSESGDDGSFTLRNLQPGSFEITAQHSKGRLSSRSEPVTAKAGDTAVTLVLEEAAKLRGRVVQETGTPITHFKIERNDYRDPQGAFEIPLEWASNGTLLFEADGFAATERKVEAEAGDKQDVDLGDVVLGKGRTLTGKVLDARTNAPLAGALVDVGATELLTESNVRLSTGHGAVVSRADGTFTLPHVEPVAMGIFATFEGYRPAAQPLGASETSLTIRLSPGTVVKGTVTDAAGKPAARAWASAHGPQGASFENLVEKGAYRLVGLPPGRFVVRVRSYSSDEVAFLPQTIDVPESGEVQVDFKEATGGTRLVVTLPLELEVMILPGEVALPAKAEELLDVTFAGVLQPDRSGADAAFSHLTPGPYTLLLFREAGKDDSLQLARQSVQVGAEPEQRIAVSMPESFQTYQRPARSRGRH